MLREGNGRELRICILLESTLGFKTFGKVSCSSWKTEKLLHLFSRLKSIWVECSAGMNPVFSLVLEALKSGFLASQVSYLN